MPKLEPKQIQKELEQGRFWPVYWLYGAEKMKSRELLKRIKKALIPEAQTTTVGFFGMQDECLDASEVECPHIVESAKSPSLSGGLRMIVIRDAHLLKDTDALEELLGPPATRDQIESVCIFISKDLDARKKFSKILVEKAAVVPCDEVADDEREAWVQYLSKRRGVKPSQSMVLSLCQMDPWTLDIIDQELEKFSLNNAADDGETYASSFGSDFSVYGGAESFLNAFFSRDLSRALPACTGFADQQDEALPLLGLFGWNLRQLVLLARDRESGTRYAKLNSYVADRIKAWSRLWSVDELLHLQAELEDLDFSSKQTPLLPLGLWSSLVQKFCS
ncbi:MAG: hypothetical protein AABZ55_07520 [Bdellovibrionota bacterium]|mgnify:CR=1 FL=1